MTTELKTVSPLQKLIHIGAVAIAMVGTLGVAVAVSGNPTPVVVAQSSFVPQSTSPAVVATPASPVVAKPVVEAKAQPELLQEIATKVVTPAPAKRTVKMVVTAYCPCTKCCGENAIGITASGKHISHNDGKFVAADRSLAFGTKLIIPGYESKVSKQVEVLDRGGAIKGNRIDVFFPTHQEALEWGRQTLEVTILD